MKKQVMIIEENKEYVYGTIVEGALTMPDDSVPLCWGADRLRAPMGVVREIHRVGNEIIGEVEIFRDGDHYDTLIEGLFSDNPMFYMGAYCTEVRRDDRDRSRIIGGRIRAVDIFPLAAYPMPKVVTQ